MTKVTSKKINIGLYEATTSDGRRFQIEDEYRARDGDRGATRNTWNVFLVFHGRDGVEKREYCQTYWTKKDCLESIEAADRGEW